MSNNKAVKKWRKNTKQRIVDAMGGECQNCGYKTCNEALELHHINPKDKDFGFGEIVANPKKWKILVGELKKCILLCANCHREIHQGLIILPNNYKIFNDEFATYEIERKKLIKTFCPICGNEKPKNNKTCSHKCARKLNGKVDWDNINLKGLLNKYNNFSKIGRMLGISDNAVRKQAKKCFLL